MRFISLFAFFLSFIAQGQNLIVNPGAELPPVGNGWTQVSGFWTNGTERPPRSGSYHFYAGDNSLGGSELYQDVNVSAWAVSIDAGLSTFSFTTWMRVYSFTGGIYNDQGRAIVEYRNGSGTVLSSYDTGLRNDLVWVSYSDARTAPVGTRSIRIRLVAARNSGTAADGYFDDLSLTHSSTLPVTLLTFEAFPTDETILLRWQTSEENSNDFFTIEKSENGIYWEAIGIVEGAKTSDQLLSYSFTDNAPATGFQYYRLKQTDADGTSTYSQMISADYSSVELTAFPNPTSGTIHLLTPNAHDGVVRIFSVTGQEVFFKETGLGTIHTLDLTNIVSGIYHLEYTGAGKISRILLRKE